MDPAQDEEAATDGMLASLPAPGYTDPFRFELAEIEHLEELRDAAGEGTLSFQQ